MKQALDVLSGIDIVAQKLDSVFLVVAMHGAIGTVAVSVGRCAAHRQSPACEEQAKVIAGLFEQVPFGEARFALEQGVATHQEPPRLPGSVVLLNEPGSVDDVERLLRVDVGGLEITWLGVGRHVAMSVAEQVQLVLAGHLQ